MRRRFSSLLSLSVCLAACVPMMARGQDGFIPYAEMEDASPVLDAPRPAWAELYAGSVLPAAASSGTDDIGMVEAGAWGHLFYVENDLGADLEGRIRAECIALFGFEGDDAFYGLTTAELPLQYTQRFEYGWGLRMDVAPGLHAGGTEFGSAWTAPTGAILVYDFNPYVALYGGATARVGFDSLLDPRVGLCFTSGERFRLEIAYPETAMDIAVSPRFHIVAGARYWNQMEYSMGSDDPRERIGLTEARAHAGFDIGVSDSSMLTLRVGYAFSRSLWFQEASPDIELDDAMSFQIGWRGLF